MCRYTCSIMFHVDCSENESQIEADPLVCLSRGEKKQRREMLFILSYSIMLSKKEFFVRHTRLWNRKAKQKQQQK